MDTRRRTRGRRRLVASLAGVAALAAMVVAPASPAGAASTVGHFETLPAGEALGLDVSGVAMLNRGTSTTTGLVVVLGLDPGATYAAHLHSQPCSAENPGSGHYMHETGAGAAPPNELWFSWSRSNPTAGINANRAGVAVGWGSASWVAGPSAQAVVIHAIPTGGTTAGGPKIACADL